MADRLNHPITAVQALRLLVLAGILTAAPAVSAQTSTADPTQPPGGFSASSPDASAVTGPVLQSVILPKKGRAVAVIGGQQVRVGEMYGESRLVRLTEREAVLEGPAGTERLYLTPGIEKTPVHPKPVNKKPSGPRAQSGSQP